MEQIILGDNIIINVNIISPNSINVPSGNVILKEGTKTIGAQLLINGATIFVINSYIVGPGIHNFTVYYPGDKNFSSSCSYAISKEVVANK